MVSHAHVSHFNASTIRWSVMQSMRGPNGAQQVTILNSASKMQRETDKGFPAIGKERSLAEVRAATRIPCSFAAASNAAAPAIA